MAERDTATAADRFDSDIVAKLNFRKPTTTCRCEKTRHRPHAERFVDRLYKNVAGVSVPSRFFDLLAIGRPAALLSEANAEAALVVLGNRLDGVVTLGRPDELAKAINATCLSEDSSMEERAVAVAAEFDRDWAMIAYAALKELLRAPELSGSR